MEGSEPPRLAQDAAWRAFGRFARVPAAEDTTDAGCTFQTEVQAEADYPVLALRLARQIGRLPEDEGAREDVRMVGCEFFMPLALPAEGIESREVWSDEFPSVDDFLAHLETLPEFALWRETPPDVADVFTTELGETA